MKFYAPKYKQLDLGLLRSSLDELDKTNRWVALGDLLPWTELEKEYNSRLDNQKKGAGNKPARMILGAMIIKHKLNLSDAETIEIIRESPYMQYFCGLHEFTDKPIFDPSLFVTIRKRISEEELNKMTVKLLNKQRRLLEEKRKREEEEAKKNDEEPPTPEPEEPNAASFTDSKGREHKGVLKIDATCADAEMRYPVDVDIIHDGCRKVTDYIMKVCEMFELHKPRTNYRRARQAYLLLVKKAKKKGKMVRETIGVMLNYLRKDIRILMDLLAKNKTYYESLFLYEKRTLTAILKMYHQQEEMYRSKTHTCADRILSIFQPHVRAIVRGKGKARTEFRAKIGASIVEGYTFIDHHNWDAYNKSQDLLLQIQLFKERFEYKRYKLPSVIAGQMKFEAMTPPHDPLAVCGDTIEHFVGIASEIVAYGYHGRINECYAGTSPKGTEVQEEQEREKHPTFKFNKTVIGNRFWKKLSHCPFYKEQVIMFEITECAKMEVQQNSDSHF